MKKRSTKQALILSILSLMMCVSMLIGSTFAWFTDSVVSGNNVIKTGTLDIILEMKDENGEWVDAEGKVLEFVKANNSDEEVLWEPGCTYRLPDIRVRNVGSLATYVIISINGINSSTDAVGDKELLEVIEFQTKVTEVDATIGYMEGSVLEPILGTPNGTVIWDESLVGKGEISPGNGMDDKTAVISLSGHMLETAGNKYQGLKLEGISITVLATQCIYEKDSFDNKYDKDAPKSGVMSYAELVAALEAGKTEITLLNDIVVEDSLNVAGNVTINGAGSTLFRASGFTGNVINVGTGAELTLTNVTVDGGAVWTGAIDPTLQRGTVNSGMTVTGNLVATSNNAKLILDDGAVLQNNDGAYAVNLGTRIGATLTMNGGQIINNNSDSGAVWGGGHIVINDGSKLNGNSSTGIGGAIRMVSSCNLTVNGGEINRNKAAGDGGAIWGYGSSTYNFNGGEMAYNETSGTGGAIYTGTYSVINIGGDFELHDNKAANSGAIRLTDHTSMNISGGKVYNNTQNGESNAFNTWNNNIVITGGEIEDNFVFTGGLGLTIGAAEIDGVIAYNLSTNHNTAYLKKDFNGFKFTVDEADANFLNFNFKPESGYVYTDGDEAKLVCLNDGYTMVWNATSATFKIQAK